MDMRILIKQAVNDNNDRVVKLIRHSGRSRGPKSFYYILMEDSYGLIKIAFHVSLRRAEKAYNGMVIDNIMAPLPVGGV